MPTKLKLTLIIALALLALPGLAYASVGEIDSASPGAERILITSDGGLVVYSSDGLMLSGFPVWAEGVFEGEPLAGDFDSAVGNEIAVVERKISGDYYLHLYDSAGTEISSTILSDYASNINPIALYNYTSKKYSIIYSATNGDVKELVFSAGVWSNNLLFTGAGTEAFLSTDNGQTLIYYAVNGGNQIKIYKKTGGWNLSKTINTDSIVSKQVVDDGIGQLWFLSDDKLYSYSASGDLVDGFPITLSAKGTDLIVADIDKNNIGLESGIRFNDGSLALYDYQGQVLKNKFIKEKFSSWQAMSLEKEQGIFTYGFNNNLTIKSGAIADNSSVLNPVPGPLFTNSIAVPNIIFNGEPGASAGWISTPNASAIIQYEDPEHGNVAVLSGNGFASDYILYTDSQKYWNVSHPYVSWEMNYAEDYLFFIYVNTDKGDYYLGYSPVTNPGKFENYVYIKLEENTKGGSWVKVTRDIQADLNTQFPDAKINNIYYAIIYGSGKVDNVETTKGLSLGSIAGVVKDSFGNLMSGVKVTLLPNNITYVTDDSGIFVFASLPYGNYQLQAEKQDWEFTGQATEIDANSTFTVNLVGAINNKPNIIFNGEPGASAGWISTPNASAIIQYEDPEHGNVAVLSGNGFASDYILYTDSQKYWNVSHPYVSWEMNYAEDYLFFIYVNTDKGDYYLGYSPVTNPGKFENYVYIKLEENTKGGSWVKVTRDIQADLNTQFPDAKINNIYYAIIYGSGKVDNVETSK